MAWCLVRHRDTVACGCRRTGRVALGAEMGETVDCGRRFEPAANGLSVVHLSGDVIVGLLGAPLGVEMQGGSIRLLWVQRNGESYTQEELNDRFPFLSQAQ